MHTDWIRFFFFVIFYFIYTHQLLCTLQKVHRNIQLVKCMTVYVLWQCFMCEPRALTLYVHHSFYIHDESSSSSNEKNTHTHTNLNFNILLLANDGCRNLCSPFIGTKFCACTHQSNRHRTNFSIPKSHIRTSLQQQQQQTKRKKTAKKKKNCLGWGGLFSA